MSSSKMIKEDDKGILTTVPTEYQKNALLLDYLLGLDTANISRFCHILQDIENQQEIGRVLINGMCNMHAYTVFKLISIITENWYPNS